MKSGVNFVVLAFAILLIPNLAQTAPSAQVSVFRPETGKWYIDFESNLAWDGCEADQCLNQFGSPGDQPVCGDWAGSGAVWIGVYRPRTGQWFLDLDGSGTWSGCGVDGCFQQFGAPGDLGVAGDIDNDGIAEVGVYRPSSGQWFFDINNNGLWDGCGTDRCLGQFGAPSDLPVVGDWNGIGILRIGVYRPATGQWFLDLNGDGAWSGCGNDGCIDQFGAPEDRPVAGDWTGTGTSKIGVYRPSTGSWFLDLNGNGAWDGCAQDACGQFGSSSDLPVAGNFPIAWAKTYNGGYAHTSTVRPTMDGGYIVAGYASGFTYSYASWILKLDALGNIEWQKAYGGFGDFTSDIRQTSDGGYIAVGYSWTFGTAGSQDAWIFKLDASGNLLWQKAIGIGGVGERALSVQLTPEGGYIIAGEWFKSSDSDMWVAKLDANGAVIWLKTYQGFYQEVANAIYPTADGGYVMAGYTGTDYYQSEAWILKLDNLGEIVWQRAFGNISNANHALDIKPTLDDGYIFTGLTGTMTYADPGDSDLLVIKLDRNGTPLWQKNFGALGLEKGTSISQLSDGNYIVVGETSSFGAGDRDLWVLKLNASGDVLWQKSYGGQSIEYAGSIMQVEDSGFVIAASTESFGTGYWILKTTSDGSINFNQASGASVMDTDVLGRTWTADWGQTFGSAASVLLSTRDTNAPSIYTNGIVTRQAP